MVVAFSASLFWTSSLVSLQFWFVFLIFFWAERGTFWRSAFLHWNEELTSKEANQEEGSEVQDGLDRCRKQPTYY